MEEKKKKILILGLDNCGKTSLIFSLMGKNLLSLLNELTPTKGMEIRKITLNKDTYIILDFGGQEAYRNNHLKNLDQHLQGANKIMYLIDVQDVERYELALNYLKNIIQIIENEDVSSKFSILLHKYDPQLEIDKKNIGEEIKKLIEDIQELMPSNFGYTIQKSTIFTVFQNTTIFQ
ncbi:MAG: ADP-ribosylation factor-like protein [Promethearchaeota archaeon]